jgi:hypothetical protein
MAILLTACATTNSNPAPTNVQPDLDDYSDAFQAQLAVELEGEARVPCPRDFMVPDCSAWKRAVIDYGHLRNGIRAAGASVRE